MTALKIAAAALFAVPVAGAVFAAPARYVIDPEHTVVAFTIGHLGYSDVLGMFGEVSGGFTYDAETRELSDVEITVGTASVDTFLDARDDHVRQPDFLGVADHPTMIFTADGGTPTGDTAGTVAGDLTMLGQTNPLVLEVTLNKAADYPFGHGRFTLGLSATGSLNRSDWGMTYGVDNGLVGDEVTLMISTEAMRMDD